MAPSFHRPHLTPEDRRFHALWSALSVVAMLAVVWASHRTVDDAPYVVHELPDRILRMLEAPEDVESPAHGERAGGPPGGGRPQAVAPIGGPALQGPVSLDPADSDAFWNFFAHPVFGSSDLEFEELVRALDGPQGLDPLDTEQVADGWQRGVGDGGRTDAGYEEVERLERGPVVMVQPKESDLSARVAAASIALTPRVRELPTAVVEQGMRSWRRHAAACHGTHMPSLSARVELTAWVEAGRVTRVEVQVPGHSEQATSSLVRCLDLRARALLQFDEDHTGAVRLPLIFERR